MLLLGGLVIFRGVHLNDDLPSPASVSGCQHSERGNPSAPVATGPRARTSAEVVSLATVDSEPNLGPVPDAQTPQFNWIRVTYRLEHTFRNLLDCRRTVEIATRIERDRVPTTAEAPFRGTRVLLFARTAQSGTFRHLTTAAPSISVDERAAVNDIRVYEVAHDPQSPPTTTGAGQPTIQAEVAEGTPDAPFLTPGPNPELPVRLVFVNTTGQLIDVATLGPSQWHVKLVDFNGDEWTDAVKVDPGTFGDTIRPDERRQVEVVTRPRPSGSTSLKEGIYRLEATLDTAGDPVSTAQDPGTTISIRCVFGCKPTG